MRVVHCKKEQPTHYCGRWPRSIAEREGRQNPLANMYAHVPTGIPGVTVVESRDEAITCFERDARANPKIRAAIMALPEDAVLGCWCEPKACHGDVIVKLWQEWHQ